MPFVGVFKYGVAGGFSIIQVVYFPAARHAYQRFLDMTTT